MSRNCGEAKTSPLVFLSSVVALVVALDQFTKFLAIQSLSQYESWPIIPHVFHLTLVHNQGVAFGLFRKHPNALIILITLSIVFLSVWIYQNKKTSKRIQVCLALILGGAIGNWIDRIRLGSVIDFLDFRVWPVFNVADSAITVGTIAYLLFVLKGGKKI